VDADRRGRKPFGKSNSPWQIARASIIVANKEAADPPNRFVKALSGSIVSLGLHVDHVYSPVFGDALQGPNQTRGTVRVRDAKSFLRLSSLAKAAPPMAISNQSGNPGNITSAR
jgi:hypothetical protein